MKRTAGALLLAATVSVPVLAGAGSAREPARAGLLLGYGDGTRLVADGHEHDLILAMGALGWTIGPTRAPGRWFGGRAELAAELLVGVQTAPSEESLSGFTLHLRHVLSREGRWRPFAGAGAGLTHTGIRDGDLSTDLEFNLQAGAGVHRLFRGGRRGLTLEYRFLHLSNAYLERPNRGLDTHTVLVGLSVFPDRDR